MVPATLRAALGLLFLLMLSGCATPMRPDLVRLYESSLSTDQPPVVLIHGVFGAKLRDQASGEELWPGGYDRLLFSDYQDLALAIDGTRLSPRPTALEAYAIFDEVAGADFYGAILRTLQSAGRYRQGIPGTPAAPTERRYYVLNYDWRQDNVESARRLDALIAQIRRDYADPGLKVDIVAHSMGGLIARYYLRYGTADVLDRNEFPVSGHGAARVRKLLLLGTPNLGSASALQHLITGFPVGLRRIPPEVLATMPSAFQLLPHPLNDWLLGPDGKALERDLFDVEIWRRFQWSVFDPAARERIRARHGDAKTGEQALATLERFVGKSLERARRFVWSLTVKESATRVPVVVFGGDCSLTPARVLVEEEGGDSVLRLYPEDIRHGRPGVDYGRLMLEPGDGSVTKASLLARTHLDPAVQRHRYSYFPLNYTVLLCERHEKLTGNPNFQDNLLHALLTRED